jgi:hypothetical protein
MRLIDHECLRTRKYFAEALLLEREIGQQQVMVDHDQVRRLRTLPRLHHETIGEEWAFAAEAVVSRRRHHRQQRRILGQRFHFGEVTHPRAPAPRDDALELRDLLAVGELRLAFRLVQAIQAQIVRAAFQQRRLEPTAERIAHAWKVAVV